MSNDPPVIAVFAGPSGGHLFPALAFSEKFKEKVPKARLFFVTSLKGEPLIQGFPKHVFEEIIFLENFPSSPGISLRTLTFLLKLVRAFEESYRCLSRLHPDLCIGFGSYVSFPGIVLSSIKKIPTLIHEQNQVPGKANRHLAVWVKTVAVSFPETFSEIPARRRALTGLPLRSQLTEAAARSRGLQSEAPRDSKKFSLLVVGGSQGANSINRAVLGAFSNLTSEEKNEFAVTHITGKSDFEAVSEAYRGLNIKARVFPFFENMEALYAEADLAVCRAGANTLFELALFGVPAILIPYPYAGGHQQENATEFVNRGAAFCEPEAALTAERLLTLMRDVKGNLPLRRKMAAAMRTFSAEDAPLRLVELALTHLKGQKP